MPIYVSGGGIGVGGRGSGFSLGPVQNEFTNAAARDTYATANATWLAQYDANRAFWIRVGGAAGNIQRRNTGGTAWENVTGIVSGQAGAVGPQGRFPIVEHANGATTPTIAGGGSFNLGTGDFTPSTGATAGPTAPGVGEDVYAREAYVDDANDSGIVDLSARWSVWVERSHLSAGISHVEVTAGDLTGTGLVADPVGLDDARKFEANPTAAATAPLLKVKLGADIFNVDEIIDVTLFGLPTITEANHRSLFIDFDTPRVWVGHRTPIADTPGTADSDVFADLNYLGAFDARQTARPASTNVYFYDTTNHYFEGGSLYNLRLIWSHRDITYLLGASARWLGEQPDSNTAANLINNFDASLRYLYFSTTAQTVREIRNNSYVAPINNANLFTAEPISSPTGVAGIFGVIAGIGMSGGGPSGVVTVDIDVTAADFPVIPIDKGGTGEDAAAAALAALGGTTLMDALVAILEGTNVTIDRSTAGEITVNAAAGSGFTLRSGSAIPQPSLGNDADWYLQITTGNMFHKSSGAWVQRLFLQNIYASLASPALTGTPTAPTAGAGTNNTQISTTAYVTAAIAAIVLGGGADGVLASAALQADGITLRLTLSNGTEIDVNLTQLISGLISAVTANEGLEGGGTTGNITVGIADGGVTYAKLAAAAVTEIRDGLATLVSPAFTGQPTAPTPADGDDSTRIATTAFVLANGGDGGGGGGAGTGTADLLVEELGHVPAPITLPDNQNWVASGITIPESVHVLLVDASSATDDYHVIDWDTIRSLDPGVVGELSVAAQFETIQVSTGIDQTVRIGHDDAGQLLFANDTTSAFNLPRLRVERLLAPVRQTLAGAEEILFDNHPTLVQIGVLGAAVNNSATLMTLAEAPTEIPTIADFLLIENEVVDITAVAGSAFTVIRGQRGTDGVTHAATVPVFLLTTANGGLGINLTTRTWIYSASGHNNRVDLNKVFEVADDHNELYIELEYDGANARRIGEIVIDSQTFREMHDLDRTTSSTTNETFALIMQRADVDTLISNAIMLVHFGRRRFTAADATAYGVTEGNDGFIIGIGMGGAQTLLFRVYMRIQLVPVPVEEVTPTQEDHNRYLALGADAVFTEADYTGGTIFNTNTVTFPTFVGAMWPGIVVPDTNPVTTFTQLGLFNQDLTGFFTQIADIDIGGTNHNQWVGTQAFPDSYSGVSLRVS